MQLPELLNIAVYAIALGLVGIGVLLGFIRGFARQTMKFVTVAVAFVVSITVFNGVYPWIYDYVADKTVLDLANTLGLTLSGQMAALFGELAGEEIIYILAVPLTVVIIPVLYIVMFILVSIILAFPYNIICGMLGFEPPYNSLWKRIIGAALGAVQGALIVGIVFSPVAGIIGVGNEAVTTVEEERPGLKNTVMVSELYHENIDLVAGNPVIKFVDEHFGFIYDKFTTIEVEGEEMSVLPIVDDMVEIYVLSGELSGFDYGAPTDYNKEIIDEMLGSFGHDPLLTIIVADAAKAFGKSAQSGALVLEIDEPLHTLVMAFMDILATSDDENVEGDLHTIAEAYYFLADEGVLRSMDINEMFAAFLTLDENGSSVYSRFCAQLKQNPRFASLAETLSKIAMDMLLQNAGVDKDTQEALTEVKDSVNNILAIDKNDYETEEEYKAAVNEELSTVLENNGISLEDDQIDRLTDFVVEEYGDAGEMTDADMADFFAKYYDIYSSGGNIGDVVIPGLNDGNDTEEPEGGITETESEEVSEGESVDSEQ